MRIHRIRSGRLFARHIGPSPDQRVTRFSAQCASCRYDLRDLGSRHCPECGSGARVPISWPLAPLRWWTVRASHVGVPLSVITLLLLTGPYFAGSMIPVRLSRACIATAIAGALLHVPVGALANKTSRSMRESTLGWVTLMLGLLLLMLAATGAISLR